MDRTVVCPGCQAQLVLPGLPAGQTVQCPKCKHVFETTTRLPSAVMAIPPQASYGTSVDTEDHELFEQPRRLVPVGRLWGSWLAIGAMVASPERS